MGCKALISLNYTFTALTHTFGRFRWVDCQLKYLARCLPVDLERALNELPATLDETYERTLGEIEDANWEAARRLLQCVVVASRPLRVEELAEILAFNFNAGPIPKFHVDCRLEDPVEAVLSICSTLLSLVNVENSRVVQFGHFSVKEFLTSTRFAKKCDAVSGRYHISMSPAHTVIARACLGILLHLPENVTDNIDDSLRQYPLTGYASEHWFEHARFEGVSQNVLEGMKRLFDQTKPHFAIWLWICNPTLPSRMLWWTGRDEKPPPPHGTPLHYATFCGLRDVVEVLAIGTHGVNSQDFDDELTPLHLASREGHLDIARFLVEHGANLAAQDKHGSTPLHDTSCNGRLDLARFFVEHGANVAAQDQHGSTPLHQASGRGHLDRARFLIEHGANVVAEDQNGSTPLYEASAKGDLNLLRLLIEHGASVAAEDPHGWTSLDVVLECRQFDVAQFLVEHGANLANLGSILLYNASERGHLGLTRALVERGVNAAAQDQCGWTPLQVASQRGHLDIARFLIEHGADAAAQVQHGLTPLHLASINGHLDLARFLVEHGANAAAQDQHGLTPLHEALQQGHLDLARFLVEHGTNAAAQDQRGLTPLHLASINGHLDLARLLVEHGANAAAQDQRGWTPLHLVSQQGHLDLARFLVEQGANVTAGDQRGCTPFHVALEWGHFDLAEFLDEHGARVAAQDQHG